MNDKNFDYLSPGKTAKIFKVANETLRTWAINGKIEFVTTEGGHRRYKVRKNQQETSQKISIIYARVSSHKQKSSLDNQSKRLRKLYPEHELVTDIGSGINFERKGFRRILDLLLEGNLEELVVTNYDRLARIGTELFDWLFEKYDSKIVVIDTPIEQNDEQELAEDLIAITTMFVARYHGRRGAKVRKKDKILPKSKAKVTAKKAVRSK